MYENAKENSQKVQLNFELKTDLLQKQIDAKIESEQKNIEEITNLKNGKPKQIDY